MVYKGCERKIIMIKNTGSSYFDEAYFILKENYKKRVSEGDMLSEANRIVNDNIITYPSKPERKARRINIRSFLYGIISGFSLTACIFLIVK